MTLTSSSIRIENTDMPLLGNIEMNPIEIHDSITGNAITFERLCYLPIGLASLEAPPNSTTLHIQDTILIDKLLNDYSNTITNEDISISKICTCESLVLSHNTITNNSSLNHFTISNTGGNDVNITSSNQVNIQSNDNINLNCGVNCIINTNSGNGIYLNSTDGIINMGDYQQNFNRTYYSLNDATKEIITNSADGVIWNGDINAIGSTASSQFNVAHRYISNFCGKMASVDEVNNTISTKIEEYGNFFISDVDIQMKEVPNYFNPLTPNGDGWYCYIMNYTGGDINLTSNDGKQFISHTFGINTNAIIKKYATVRVTLTYITPLGDYYWSVMQF